MQAEEDPIQLPRSVLRLPLEIVPPAGFLAEEPATWPSVQGRLEYVRGRLLFMPPCGKTQQVVAVDVVTTLRVWARSHAEFVVGGNEAGMILGEDVRGAEAAVWRRADYGTPDHRFARTPPLLVVEVAGRDEGEPELREKARWYLGHGVGLVWLVLPDSREVICIRVDGESRHGAAENLPEPRELPGLTVTVADFFQQLDA